jgi:serine/threonine protein phosphatase PrpC
VAALSVSRACMKGYSFSHAALTDSGQARERNEDALIVVPEAGVFGVADGMGGAAGGDVASRALAERVAEHVRAALAAEAPSMLQAVRTAVDAANTWIRETAAQQHTEGMGTTVALLLLPPDLGSQVVLLHAGDSRVYRWRGNRLEQLTRDHSLSEAINRGDEQMPVMFRGIVTRAVGTKDLVELEETQVDTEPNDIFMVCSDGLTKMLPREALQSIHKSWRRRSMSELARALVDGANRAGGRDNISVVLVWLRSGKDSGTGKTTSMGYAGGNSSTATGTARPLSDDTPGMLDNTPLAAIVNPATSVPDGGAAAVPASGLGSQLSRLLTAKRISTAAILLGLLAVAVPMMTRDKKEAIAPPAGEVYGTATPVSPQVPDSVAYLPSQDMPPPVPSPSVPPPVPDLTAEVPGAAVLAVTSEVPAAMGAVHGETSVVAVCMSNGAPSAEEAVVSNKEHTVVAQGTATTVRVEVVAISGSPSNETTAPPAPLVDRLALQSELKDRMSRTVESGKWGVLAEWVGSQPLSPRDLLDEAKQWESYEGWMSCWFQARTNASALPERISELAGLLGSACGKMECATPKVSPQWPTNEALRADTYCQVLQQAHRDFQVIALDYARARGGGIRSTWGEDPRPGLTAMFSFLGAVPTNAVDGVARDVEDMGRAVDLLANEAANSRAWDTELFDFVRRADEHAGVVHRLEGQVKNGVRAPVARIYRETDSPYYGTPVEVERRERIGELSKKVVVSWKAGNPPPELATLLRALMQSPSS